MEDTGQRKAPPDRQPDSPDDGRDSKKKKTETVPNEIMDDTMHEKEAGNSTQGSPVMDNATGKLNKPMLSYKQSLVGFNGVANGGASMEPEDLLFEDEEIFWKMPEPSEEIKRLKKIYPVVPICEEEYIEWCKPWNFSLIITVLGKRFNLFLLKSQLTRLWGISDFELIDLPNNYFVVKFTNKEQWRSHYKKVLYEGPWVLFQHCVLVQRWTPYFDPFKNQGFVFHKIPLHCCNHHCIARMGERIGKPLKVDLHTLAEHTPGVAQVVRGRYARLCVELDLQKKLVPKIIAAEEVFSVEYEGLRLICFECGRYGRRREACPHKKSAPHPQENGQTTMQEERIPSSERAAAPVSATPNAPAVHPATMTMPRIPLANPTTLTVPAANQLSETAETAVRKTIPCAMNGPAVAVADGASDDDDSERFGPWMMV